MKEGKRGKRRLAVGAKSENLGRLNAFDKQRLLRRSERIEPYERPKTRGDCVGGARPCLYVGCKYNLYLDIGSKSPKSLKFNFPDREPEEMKDSCVLDIADEDGTTLDDVSMCMNLTREAVRLIEVKAIKKLEEAKGLEEHNDTRRRKRSL